MFEQLHQRVKRDCFRLRTERASFTRTQIKVIVTVVLIISFIMIIIAIFRFRNACRHREDDNLQTDILRARAAQYNEPSSRRGSVGVSLQDDFVCKEL
ncbi:unnamed protein product [Adineta ricciae]|uniref:Uncharacterized protein n=1 Tax=Adineta ricciae TaxID=249248 RepID=A0A814R659_ADIRI|nr:unnamed protein product [Adineta ricciae]